MNIDIKINRDEIGPGYLSKRAERRLRTKMLLETEGGWDQLIEAIQTGAEITQVCIDSQLDTKMIRAFAAEDEHRLRELEAAEDMRSAITGNKVMMASTTWLTADPADLFKREIVPYKDENGVEQLREVTVMRDILDIPRLARQSIQSIKIETVGGISCVKEVKLVDKTRAAEVLMKAAGIGKTVGQEVAGDFLDELTRRVAEARKRMIAESA